MYCDLEIRLQCHCSVRRSLIEGQAIAGSRDSFLFQSRGQCSRFSRGAISAQPESNRESRWKSGKANGGDINDFMVIRELFFFLKENGGIHRILNWDTVKSVIKLLDYANIVLERFVIKLAFRRVDILNLLRGVFLWNR